MCINAKAANKNNEILSTAIQKITMKENGNREKEQQHIIHTNFAHGD